MGVSAAPLVGRAEELSVLDRALDDVARGRWTAVELVGEPGIGKTRLLEELKARADRRGALVLSGSASELERDLPFWMFVNALDDYVRSLDPRLLERLDDEVRAELAHVFPALAGFAASKPATLVHERYRTHRAVRELLERLTATGPLVLVLDDLHWADPASVELLGALLRRPPEAAVVLALARRPDQGSQRVGAELGRTRGGEAIVRVPLGALARSEAEELLGGSVDRAGAATLYLECGGNPFYLEQLARSLERGDDGSAVLRGLTLDLDVPPTVAAALAEELALLSESSHTVLRGAAVVGDPFEPEMAAAAAGVTESAAIAVIDELLGTTLIRRTDVPRRFRFRHPLLRRAVYQSAPAGWRLKAHERSAAALAARGTAATERAHHVERSARKGDHAAVSTLREAGEAAAHRAPESAARWFAAAVRLLRDDAPAEERVELLLSRAAALASCGHFDEGYAALLESLELLPPEAVALRVRLTTACAGMEHLLGRHELAHGRLAAALDGLQDAASAEAVALMLELAMDGVYRMEFPPVADQAGQALEVARPLGYRPVTASAAAALAWGAALGGLVPAARKYRAEASGLVDQLSDGELAQRLDAGVNLAGAELYLDLFSACGRHAERVISVARATGQPAFIPFAFMILAWVRMLRGELRDGAEMLDAAIEESRLLGNAQSLAGLLLNRSLTALAAGDLELAATTAREAVQLTEGMDAGLIPAATTLALAAAYLETSDARLDAAVDLMVRRCGGPELPNMPGGSFRAKWLELLTRCSLALQRPGDAERAASRAEGIVDPLGGLRMAVAMAERAAAAVAFDRGHVHEAARRALTSAGAADEVGIPVEAALSRTLAGRALARADQVDLAIVELEKAAASLHASGASKYRDAADLELRRLGVHVHRRSGRAEGTGVESLTRREREVADLVVDRRTKHEIAQALFLSPKTVETHLRHIFHKLDVTSRAEVARAVEASSRHKADAGRVGGTGAGPAFGPDNKEFP
jgi:DNA-binding CsgD family transcriptional regulator/tetratricopeptide (TPR) repeat protein